MSERLLSVRNTRRAPIVELFDQGLSFRLMLSWGTLPPLATMNKFLACGRDDTDADDGLVEWEQVALTQSEYDCVVRDLKQRGHHVQLESVPPGTSAASYETGSLRTWPSAHPAALLRAPSVKYAFQFVMRTGTIVRKEGGTLNARRRP